MSKFSSIAPKLKARLTERQYGERAIRRDAKKYAETVPRLIRVAPSEVGLLATVMNEGAPHTAHLKATTARLDTMSFSSTEYATVWDTVCLLIDSGHEPNARNVRSTISMAGEASAEVQAALDDIESATPLEADEIDVHIGAIADASAKRELQMAALGAAHAAGDATPGQLAQQLADVSDSVVSQMERDDQTGADLLAMLVQEGEDKIEGRGAKAYPCGIHTLDDMLDGGFQAGRLYYIGGAEKVGKTRFVTHVVGELMAEHDAHVSWYSVEMTEVDTMRLLVAHRSSHESSKAIGMDGKPALGVSNSEMRTLTKKTDGGRIIDNERHRRRVLGHIGEVGEQVAAHDLTIRLVGGETVEDLEAAVRARNAQIGESGRPHVVVVDYIQDLSTKKRVQGEREQIMEASKVLRNIAKKLGVIAIGIFHANRAAQTAGGRPSAHNVYGSHQLSKDADHLIMLHRPYSEGDEARTYGWYTEALQVRTRHGGGYLCRLVMHFDHCLAYEFDRYRDEIPPCVAEEYARKEAEREEREGRNG